MVSTMLFVSCIFVYKSYQFSTIMLYTHIVIVIAAVAQTMSETKNR